MLKENIEINENILANNNEIEKLKKVLPNLFDKNGNFLQDRLNEMLKKMILQLIKKGMSLNF